MEQYTAIYQVECTLCSEEPVVAIRAPSGRLASTGLCGPHFFGDRAMSDPELWNEPQEATE